MSPGYDRRVAARGSVWPVPGRFQFSRPPRRSHTDPWFRVGTVDIGSAPLLASLCALSFVVYAIEGPTHPVLRRTFLDPEKVLDGQVWRVVTWPLTNSPSVWTAVAIAVLWYFGSRLEESVGRTKMLGYLLAVIVVPGIAGTLLDLPQGGVRVVELVVLLTFVAEYPHVRFFFGIPGWILGVVIVTVEFLSLVGDRDGKGLLFYAIALTTGAVAARSIGLLADYHFIPKVPLPGGKRRGSKKRAPSGRAVVAGPWAGTTDASSSAQAELDHLLDKISAGGMDSLTRAEKQRLNELSKRLRGS
jgi:membrane associated rhomboid family serine protease